MSNRSDIQDAINNYESEMKEFILKETGEAFTTGSTVLCDRSKIKNIEGVIVDITCDGKLIRFVIASNSNTLNGAGHNNTQSDLKYGWACHLELDGTPHSGDFPQNLRLYKPNPEEASIFN